MAKADPVPRETIDSRPQEEPITTVGDPSSPTVAGEESDPNGGAKEELEEVLAVRYFGRSDGRILSSADVSGDRRKPGWSLTWTPGAEVPYEFFVRLAGSDARAREVLKAHAHEFKLVGPGSAEFWNTGEDEGAEEFEVSVPVQ